MSRISVTATIIISAVIGAVAGCAISFFVFQSNINKEIKAQIATLTTQQAGIQNQGQNLQVSYDNGSTIDPTKVADNNQPTFVNGLDPTEQVVSQVYRELSPSVVHVSTTQYYRNFFFQVVPQEGTGSGFIISEDGYILTNNHVVQGAQEITVRLSSGDEYPAELVGTDQMTDIAVLKIPSEDIDPSWVATLGDSDALIVGQRAIAIGNPFGLDSTVTAGVVSALNRPVSTQDTSYENMIQTDASINPGNSGGPLIDSAGEVIGINTVIFSQSGGSQGINFAIPVNAAKRVSNDLIEFGRVKRPSLGFAGLTIRPNLAQALELPVKFGVLVQDIENGSAAEAAGLQGGTERVVLQDQFRQYSFYRDGDIVIALNGEKIEDWTVLSDKIVRMPIGTEVTLTIMRGDQQMDIQMTLAE
jgi:S1-C subfamily serine protease